MLNVKSQEDYYQHFISLVTNQNDLLKLKKAYDFDATTWPKTKIAAYHEIFDNWNDKF